MSKVIPDDYTDPVLGDYTAFRKIRAADWQTLVNNLNRLYGDLGCDIPSFASPDATPTWQTTASTYTQFNDLAALGLGNWCPNLTGQRFTLPDATAIQVSVRAFIEDADILVRLYDRATATTLSSVTLTQDATPTWHEDELTVSAANAVNSSIPRDLILYAEGRARNSRTAKLWQLHAHERILTSADTSLLPDGS